MKALITTGDVCMTDPQVKFDLSEALAEIAKLGGVAEAAKLRIPEGFGLVIEDDGTQILRPHGSSFSLGREFVEILTSG